MTNQPSRRTEYELRQRARAQDAEDRLVMSVRETEALRRQCEAEHEIAYAWCRRLDLPLWSPPRMPEAIDALGREIERLRRVGDAEGEIPRHHFSDDEVAQLRNELYEIKRALRAVEDWFRKPRPNEEWPEASTRLDEVLRRVRAALAGQ